MALSPLARLKQIPTELGQILAHRRDVLAQLDSREVTVETALRDRTAQTLKIDGLYRESTSLFDAALTDAKTKLVPAPALDVNTELRYQRIWARTVRLLDSFEGYTVSLKVLGIIGQAAAQQDKDTLTVLHMELASYLESRKSDPSVMDSLYAHSDIFLGLAHVAATQAIAEIERNRMFWPTMFGSVRNRLDDGGKHSSIVTLGWNAEIVVLPAPTFKNY